MTTRVSAGMALQAAAIAGASLIGQRGDASDDHFVDLDEQVEQHDSGIHERGSPCGRQQRVRKITRSVAVSTLRRGAASGRPWPDLMGIDYDAADFDAEAIRLPNAR